MSKLFIAILVIIVLAIGGYFACQKFFSITPPFAVHQNVYKNIEYGFELTFPDSWKGYSVVAQNWEGHEINNFQQTYSGPEIIIKNPQTTSTQQWQDIPIMVFTPDVWKMVSGPNATVAVSAAPIGPEKIGENSKYIFATPPRWYGFTDAVGFEEAVNIVKTFKAL